MPRRLTFILTAASIFLLAAMLGFVLFRNRRPESAPIEAAIDDRHPLAETAPPPPLALPVPAPGSLRRRQPVARDAGPALDEGALMTRLRSLVATDPPLTLQLARQGNAAFPDSPDAPERAWMAVKSLVNMERFKEAHDEAQTMVNRYPGTSWSQDIQRHLLSNPLD